MSAIEHFFGPNRGGFQNALSLQVLFADPVGPDEAELTVALRAGSEQLADAVVEIDPEIRNAGFPVGVARWGEHSISFITFNAPMPAELVDRCVAPAHYGRELKERARAHRAFTLLYHTNDELPPLERYAALALLAGVLGRHGGLVVVNESARTSLPVAVFAPGQTDGDWVDVVRSMPLLMLDAGFVKYNVAGVERVWMRTYGCHHLGLPDLAMLAEGHHEGQQTFELFGNMLSYLLDSGARFGVGHTMQVGDDKYLRLRAPREEENFLDSEGELFFCDYITAEETNNNVNRRR